MKLVNGQIQVAGDQWLIFLYANYTYNAKDPWNGLLRSGLLISVSIIVNRHKFLTVTRPLPGLQTHLYIS
jgi:hypothetical protein